MRKLAALLILALLAGCSGPDAPDGPEDPSNDGGDVAEVRNSAMEDGSITFLDHEADYDINDPLPAAAMDLPAGLSVVQARVMVTTSGPCGIVAPEAPASTSAVISFNSPSGKRTEAEVAGPVCQMGPLAGTPAPATLQLEPEAGTWSIEIGGRGLSAHVHIIVEGNAA